MLVAICLGAITLFFIFFFSWFFSAHGWLYRDKKIPSPPEAGILGHAKAVNPLWSHEGANYLSKWCAVYPRAWKLRLGPFVEVVTSDPKIIKRIFSDKPEKNHNYKYAIKWLGDGLLFSRSTKWFMRRRLLTPSFHFDILKSYIEIFNETTGVLIQKLRDLDGKPVEVFPQVLSMSLDTILRCLLSYETNCQTTDDEYAQLMYRLTVIVIDRIYSPETALDSIFYMTPKGREYKRLRARFIEITRAIVESRIQKHKDNPNLLDDADKLDFLDVLLTAKYDDGSSLSIDEVMEEANVFIFEGHDTTASGISWSLFQLACHDEYRKKCFAEIKDLFDKEGGGRFVTQQQINSLPFFGLCIKECLRLKSPVPYIGRELAKEIKFDDFTLPKGTSVEVVIEALHRQKHLWKDPETFWPERFLPENSVGRDPYAYIPFSAGSRNCIGQTFAVTELKMAVAKVLYNFELATVDPDSVKRINTLVQKPVNLNLRFLSRE